ncbi:hypothetical protein [Sphaerimonospora thailandensis]|uniref:DUF3168 domain-containing protein n=1 Tax=Sphaerimonospora thailandensis TaxID=795644 RepID=A0A8J3R752_9ACTN|nr:hypothetical protein [Sphaerimonospora thailandensis]GIH70342.1 hypothetical protein Mth01_25950 [Sphaerimonospora thailandensis]
MTEPLESLPLVQALLKMLQAALSPGCPVYLAGAPRDAPEKYAVLYPDTGAESQVDRTLADTGPNDLRYQITSVGVGPEQALWVADRTNGTLLTTAPVVAGRRVRKAIREGSQPMRRDDDSTGLYYATAQYLTRSDPL